MGTRSAPRVSPSKRIRDYGSFTVIYDRKENSYIFLDDVGHDMFSLLREGKSLIEIAKKISALYFVSPEKVTVDLEGFLSDMVYLGVLEADEPLQLIRREDVGCTIDTHLLPSESHLFKVMADNLCPFSVAIEITDSCNQDCIHCYRPPTSHNIWTPKTFEKLLLQLRDLGTLHIDFTGGEPFAHPHVMELVGLCEDTDFVLTILTNGTLISEKDIETLSRIFLRKIYVSLYSAKRSIHDSITQVEGSFKSTLAAITNMVAADIPVALNCPVMNINQNDVAETLDLAESLGIHCEFTFKITPSYRENKRTHHLNCFSKELLSGLISNPRIRLYEGLMCKYQPNDGQGKQRIPSRRYCQAGFRSFTVNPQGEIILCTAFRYPCGNLQDQPIRNIWEQGEFLNAWRSELSIVNGRCQECDAFQFCEPCPANSYATSGSVSEIDELTCEFGKTLYDVAKAHHEGGDVFGKEALHKAEDCDY